MIEIGHFGVGSEDSSLNEAITKCVEFGKGNWELHVPLVAAAATVVIINS